MDWKGFSCKLIKTDGSEVINKKSTLEGEDMIGVDKIVLTPRNEALNKSVTIDVDENQRISFVKRVTATAAEIGANYSQSTYIVRVKQGDVDLSYHINQKGEVTITNDFQKDVR